MSHAVMFYDTKSPRGASVITTLEKGIAQADMGDKAKLYTENEYRKLLPADYCILYGLSGNLMQIAQDYWTSDVPTIFFDLPYWGRKHEPYPQCHRFAINGYQPTAYFRRGHASDRFDVFERTIQDWQTGGEEILVVGMSEKQTQVWGLGASWNFHASLIGRIREHTQRPIAWRPKPSCVESNRPIPDTRFATGRLDKQLRQAHCVVTYRSNVAIDGLIAGVPCIVLGDHPAEIMGSRALQDIESPYYPADRLEFCSDLAHCQLSMTELRNGFAWKKITKQVQRICK